MQLQIKQVFFPYWLHYKLHALSISNNRILFVSNFENPDDGRRHNNFI